MSKPDDLDDLYHRLHDLPLALAIEEGWVGRRRLQRKWGLTRSEAEELLDRVRNPVVSPADVILIDTIDEHVYDEDQDLYRFEGEDQFGGETSFDVPGDKLSHMKKDYTIGGYTIKEVAVKHGFDEYVFDQIRRHLEWTHGSVPVTDEELKRDTPDEVAERMALEVRKAETRSKIEKAKRRDLRRDAEKWRNLDHTLLEEFLDLLEAKEIKEPPAVQIPSESVQSAEPHMLILPVFDLHYGKRGIVRPDGTSYNRKEAGNRLMQKTQELIDDIVPLNIDKIVLAFGSDHFHIDNYHGATTGRGNNDGTFQDLDGLPAQILDEGCDLMLDHINMLRQLDVEIDAIMIPGNHDRLLSFALLKFLEGIFQNAQDVNVIKNFNSRYYDTYGKTLYGFDHGDGIKKKDIPSLVASEARNLMSNTTESVFFTGHLHHEIKIDLGSVTAYQLASLSGADRWHEVNGYVAARKQMTAFAVGRDRGMHYQINLPVFV